MSSAGLPPFRTPREKNSQMVVMNAPDHRNAAREKHLAYGARLLIHYFNHPDEKVIVVGEPINFAENAASDLDLVIHHGEPLVEVIAHEHFFEYSDEQIRNQEFSKSHVKNLNLPSAGISPYVSGLWHAKNYSEVISYL